MWLSRFTRIVPNQPPRRNAKSSIRRLEHRSRQDVGQSHNPAQDRLACGLYCEPRSESRPAFSTGCQPNVSERLSVSHRHPGPGFSKLGQALRKDFALAERIATVEFAHREAQLDSASCTGSITQDPPIVAMHGGRRESTKGTASCGMRCNDSNDQTGCGDLNLINQHP